MASAVVINLVLFNRELQDFARKQVPGVVLAVTKKGALNVHGKAVRFSPVNFGFYRFNWQLSISAPSEVVLKQAGDPQAAEQTALAVLSSLQPFQVVWLSNPSSQAETIERGKFKPPNPPTDPKSLARRAASRGKQGSARRAQARAETGSEGGPFVKGGYSIHPLVPGPVKGVLAVALAEATAELAEEIRGL